MIKVTVSNTIERRTLAVDEKTTVNEILKNTGMVFSASRARLNDTPLTAAEMDSPLGSLGVGDACRVACVAGQNNASCGVSIVGAVAVLESDLTLEQIRIVKKHRPDALVVVDKNDNPVFDIDLAETAAGSLDKKRAAFGTATSMNGNATITIPLEGHADPVAYIAEEYGACLTFIRKLEDNALSQMGEIEEERAAVRHMITRA